MKISDLLKSNNDDGSFLFNDRQRAIKNHRLMQWAKVATFGLYIVAVFMLYVSDVWGIASFVEKNSNEYIALAIFSTISFVLAYFLASSKEAVYEDIAIHRSEGWKLKPTQYAAMILFLSSGLLFEMFSATNNQQHIANTAAENSGMMKSIQGTDVTVAGSVALTESLQKAQVRLATCNKLLAQGKVKDCVESQANVKAVQESMTMSNQLAQNVSESALDNKTANMLKVRASFDKPMFREIGKAAGGDNNTGMLMVVGVLIFIFECQHIMALFAYANALYRLKQSGASFPQGVERTPSPADAESSLPNTVSQFADSAKQTVSEYAQKVEEGLNASPEVIATEYARAQQAREQFYKSAADKLDGLTPENLTRERFFKLMYMEIRSRVLNGDVRPTVTPVTEAVTDIIRQHTKALGLQPSLIGKPERQKIAEKILEKLEREQVLELNPVQGVGNPKYLLAQRWRNEPASPIPVQAPMKPDMPQLVETSGFKQSPEQRAMVDHLHQEQMQTYRQELRNGEKVYSDQPLDKPRPVQQMSVADTVKQIERDVNASSANTPEEIKAAVFDSFAAMPHPAPLGDAVLAKLAGKLSEKTATPLVPVNQKPGGTGLQNPALGSAEEHYPLPLPTTTPDCLKGSDRTTPETTPEQSPETTPRTTKRGSLETTPQLPKGAVSTPEEGGEKSDSYGLFEAWRGAVLAGLKPSSGKFYQFAREHGSFAGIANRELDLMWNGFGERGVNEGWLTVNPDYKQGSTSPKFKLNADIKQAA